VLSVGVELMPFTFAWRGRYSGPSLPAACARR
jgi:hypothetical protein